MSEPFLGQITIFAFNFAPRGFAQCDGQILPMNQNQSLYALLGTMYGGDGRTTFGLPDLRGRVPIHFGNGLDLTPRNLGQKAGDERVQLTTAQMPQHTHALRADGDNSNRIDPANHVLGKAPSNLYGTLAPGASPVAMATPAVSSVGANQDHNNMQPFLTVNFCIALQGLFPSRN